LIYLTNTTVLPPKVPCIVIVTSTRYYLFSSEKEEEKLRGEGVLITELSGA